MHPNDHPRDPSNHAIGDANVERLLNAAYCPELPDPEFVRHVAEQMQAEARSPRKARSLAIGSSRDAWIGALLAVALTLLLAFGLRWSDDSRGKDTLRGDTTASAIESESGQQVDRAPLRPVSWQIGDAGLTPRQRSPRAADTIAAIGETIETGARERRRVALADGSVLYLNQQTRVSVDAPRQVSIRQGELFVEVAPPQPAADAATFLVHTPDRKLTALGTKFDVTVGQAGTGVFVTQGRVRLDGLAAPVEAGQQLLPESHAGPARQAGPTVVAAPRLTHLLDWTKDLMADAESPLTPRSKHAGGSLVVLDSSGQESRLSLRKYHVDVHIEDGFARTTIDQTYFNHESRRLEGTFYFPLPPDASISRLAMYVDGKRMEGGMVERDYGRQVFETIMSKALDPALLEWVDGSTFKMRVFPLEGRQEKRIILSYAQRLPSLYGKSQYRFPAGHSLDAVGQWSLAVRVRGGEQFKWNCVSHELAERREAGDLRLSAQAQHVRMERDIVLNLVDGSETSSPANSAPARFSIAEQDGSRYLMLRYRPDLIADIVGRDKPSGRSSSNPQSAIRNPQSRDWVFLFESSGDRDPLLARVQADVIKTILENVGHDDTFAIVTAGTRVRTYPDQTATPGPGRPPGPTGEAGPGRPPGPTVTRENIAAAMRFLDETHLIGALDLGQALDAAANYAKASKNPCLVHVGSGIAALGVKAERELIGKIPSSAQYVGVGVGKRWNRNLMQQAASRTGGYVTQINPDEPVGWRAFELLATLNTPRLLNVKVIDDREQLRFLPFADSVAAGEELCAVAKLDANLPLPKSLVIDGLLDGRAYRHVVPEAGLRGIGFQPVEPVIGRQAGSLSHARVASAGYLPRFWAKLEIDRLVSEDSAGNRPRIVELSKAMYVMSPFTSLLVLENETMYAQYNVDRGRKDHWALYNCPETIPVVREPLVDQFAGHKPTLPAPAAENKQSGKDSPENVLYSLQVRLPPRWSAGSSAFRRPGGQQPTEGGTTNDWSTHPIAIRAADLFGINGVNWWLADPRYETKSASLADFDSLIDLITSTVRPSSWDAVGGPGSIAPFESRLSLIVSQTQQVHESISERAEMRSGSIADREARERIYRQEANDAKAEIVSERMRSSGQFDEMRRRMEFFNQLQGRADAGSGGLVSGRSPFGGEPSSNSDFIGQFRGFIGDVRVEYLPEFDRLNELRALPQEQRRALLLQRQRGMMDTLRALEGMRMPTPDDPPIFYPDTDFWRALTERRKEFSNVSMFDNTTASQRIAASLNDPTIVEFVDTPLTDVLDYLKSLHKIEIQIDAKALDDSAVDSMSPVTLNLRGISLKSALKLMLKPYGLTYVVKDEVMLITTRPEAQALLNTRAYPVADFVLPVRDLDVGETSTFAFRSQPPFGRMYARGLDARELRQFRNRGGFGRYDAWSADYEYDVNRFGTSSLDGNFSADLDIPFQSGPRPFTQDQSPPSLLFQRPQFANDPRVFSDLVSYAPGMNTTFADIQAVLAAEAELPLVPQRPGQVDAAARQLIERARGSGWQNVTLLDAAGKESLSIDVDGTGRHRYQWTTSYGLVEQVLCDGQSLWHVYPELGLGARRTMSRFHRGDLQTVVPWFLPPVEELSLGADLISIAENTVEIVPHRRRPVGWDQLAKQAPAHRNPQSAIRNPQSPGGPASAGADLSHPTATAAKPASEWRLHLQFAADGRLAERRLVDELTKTRARVTYAADGTVVYFGADDNEIARTRRVVKPAGAPQLAPDEKELVILPLPLRSIQHLRKLGHKREESIGDLSEAKALELLAAHLCEGREQVRQIVSQRFFQRGDLRLGFYTLLVSASDSQPASIQGISHLLSAYLIPNGAKSALAEFIADLQSATSLVVPPSGGLLLQSATSLRDANRLAERGAKLSGFLPKLAEFRRQCKFWQELQPKTLSPVEIARERQRALDFVDNCGEPAFAWTVLGLLDSFAGQDRERIAAAYERFENRPGLYYAARYCRAAALAEAEEPDRQQARKLFAALFRDAAQVGLVPRIDGSFFYAAYPGDSQDSEPAALLRELATTLAKAGNRPGGVLLAWQCHELHQPALASDLIEIALTGAEGEERLFATLAAIRFLWHTDQSSPRAPREGAVSRSETATLTGQNARADALLANLVAEAPFAEIPALWRLGAVMAGQRGLTSRQLFYLDRVLDLEYKSLTGEAAAGGTNQVDLATIRAGYGELLNLYQQAATAMAALEATPSADFARRVVRATDRWRFFEDDPTAPCQSAARVFSKLGQDALAWDYLTTPLAGRSNEAGPWLSLAKSLQAEDLKLADWAYTTAFALEPTNAQILWDRAAMLSQAGQSSEARRLYRQLADASWQPRFESLKRQAQQLLGQP